MKRLVQAVYALAIIHNLVIGDELLTVEMDEDSSDEEEMETILMRDDDRKRQFLQFVLDYLANLRLWYRITSLTSCQSHFG